MSGYTYSDRQLKTWPAPAAAAKVCSRCATSKPLDAFGPDARKPSGRESACRSCETERKRIYAANNAEKERERKRIYREANRDRQRAWMIANPHAAWKGEYRRRAKLYGFTPIVKDFTRPELIARYGDACYHCSGPFQELDHYPVPVAHGGAHTLDNCKPACKTCQRKQASATRQEIAA